jgi:bifunctional UDP-N-acetylglucosamine pyrophosphorylase/glucosamine-1-phosphate N-acetyltransferase
MVLPTRHLARWLGALRDDNAQREYYLTDVIALAVGEGVPVRAVQPASPWEVLGVNSKAQLAELERVYRHAVAGRLLAAGVTLADPARIDVRGRLECGRDVAIDVNCVFEGEVVLGDRVSLGANCVLRNVRVAADTRIEPFCHLEEADIGRNCRIGPYARLRPGAQLARDVHIGNFVEVKASTIGAGSKANHLAYIGDSEVGRNVNVGAGTITCNYDGANKHRTVIEDDVFIGSDTQLVAPVRVGRGATLGAGTTLTEDAPPGELTISRVRQSTIPGWKRPVKAKK